jgi:hypothetical protein
MNMRTLVFAGTALLLSLSQPAKAVSINGSFPLSGFTVSQNGADLSASNTISMADTLVSGPGLGDFSPIPTTTSFGPATLDLSSLAALAAGFSLNNATYGSFAATSAVIIQQNASFLDVYMEGVFTPVSPGLSATLDPSAASARISVNQNGQSLSAAITLNSPPTGVPEPATVSVVAGGLVLLGLARRRAAKR